MVELCLFDLDNTLVWTDDLQDIRPFCYDWADDQLMMELWSRFDDVRFRRIYSECFLVKLREVFPCLKFGVFTRAPRRYTYELLNWAYPKFSWDVIIAFEDVLPTKPFGNGVLLAMERLGITNNSAVVLVGDSDVDVKASYNSGCLAAVDKRGFSERYRSEHWRALSLIPDAIFECDADVLNFLKDPHSFLPNMERLLEGGAEDGFWRYDKLWYILPRNFDAGDQSYPIMIAGRRFSRHQSVCRRRQGHFLTDSIETHKDAEIFPWQWVENIRNFITKYYKNLPQDMRLVVSVIPHRPGRVPRLESLLHNLESSINASPLCVSVICVGDLFVYAEGVSSSHGKLLSRQARFNNVRDHLWVNKSRLPKDCAYLVIDDVVTTGASLIYARRRLESAGAHEVELLGLSKSIGDIYTFQ